MSTADQGNRRAPKFRRCTSLLYRTAGASRNEPAARLSSYAAWAMQAKLPASGSFRMSLAALSLDSKRWACSQACILICSCQVEQPWGERMSGIADNAPDGGTRHRPAHKKSSRNRRKHLKARYVLAASGLILAGIGSWALIELKGRTQALLSAFIVIGLVLIIASMLDFKKKEITLELILAVAGAVTRPYTVWNVGGIHILSYPDLRWAGYYLPVPDQLCNYKVSLFAREIKPAGNPGTGTGWGYALGACNKTTPAAPFGFSLQYAFFRKSSFETIGALEIVHLPQANTFPNGVGQGSPYPLDYKWHEWTLVVAHNQVQAFLDDDYKVAQEDLIGPGLPDSCTTSGVFIRVWGGTAQFHDLSIMAV
jgi:hypothetical protein